MRFSEHYGITRDVDDDWFDPLLMADTALYVDPFRIYVDDDAGQWGGAHDHLLRFFGMALAMVKDARGNDRSPAWQKAKNLLLFPEPAEFCLGVARGSTKGSGSSHGLQVAMLEGARAAVGLGIDEVEHMELLVLFQEGIGVDRLSDIVCNVLKSYFIRYTQATCRRHDVPTRRVRVRHSDWNEQFAVWDDRAAELPVNPIAKGSVLLVPERFLREIPTVDASDFWDYAWSNQNEQLRGDFNYDLSKNVPAHVKARLARQYPDVAIRYLKSLESRPKPAYDVERDPEFRVRWYESGRDFAQNHPLSYVPQSPDGFPHFVRSMIGSFAHGLEESDAWRLLWNDSRPRGERDVQALFRSTVLHYCRANGIVLSSESNAGRGPVDFKFAADWHAQALVEVKLASNSHYWDGLQQQTVQYLKSEEVQVGFYVTVCFTDADFRSERRDRVARVAESVSDQAGKEIIPVFVDAAPKTSASKLRGSRTTDH
jgi:hypothetical protein